MVSLKNIPLSYVYFTKPIWLYVFEEASTTKPLNCTIIVSMIFEKRNMVLVCKGREQSVGGLGVEASRDKEQEERKY